MITTKNVNSALEMYENVFTAEKLQATISFTSLFVLLFESFKYMVVDKPKGLYCWKDMKVEDGKFIYKESEKYKQKVRSLDKKLFHASLKWFLERDVITEADYNRTLEAESRRNEFVHELAVIVNYGVTEGDKKLLTDLFSIYMKIDSWWIYQEIDWDEIEDPEKIRMEECHSVMVTMIGSMIEILLDGKADTYKNAYLRLQEKVMKNVVK